MQAKARPRSGNRTTTTTTTRATTTTTTTFSSAASPAPAATRTVSSAVQEAMCGTMPNFNASSQGEEFSN